ncbi:glycoside hydrolase family 2 protein [Sphingomonas ginsenosidivorax]|uniref:Glycoside hydrolase family 2 protein n=1 Tax=Sphingomonas ginsenosidivorax TaxID=862135 RepID=A0A5C6UER7_9SPHN|nr:sugar-binding domain-containing protein [Sphingomonas ginsenosidivorax]TXC70458.1 glycoside hydrolase family 2 protein [Sphingomonas ginsenosidivorax]
MRARYLAATAVIALASPAVRAHDASSVVASARATYNLNPGWQMTTGDKAGAAQPGFDDRGWTPVTLPNAFNEREAFARDIKNLSTGITWYRKRFTAPSRATAGKAFLEFEGVRQAAEVWVNGQSVALSESGAMAFGADISKALKPGSNVIAVRVDNDWRYKERATGSGFQWNDRNFNVNYGGITRNVRLHLTPRTYQTLPLFANLGTTGQYVWADAFDIPGRAATVHAETQVRNEEAAPRTFSLRTEVRDRDGTLVGRFDGGSVTLAPGETRMVTAQGRMAGLNFWSWGYGYLYRVTTSLVEGGKVADAVDTLTGFRSTQFGDGMIRLNGRVMQVHGYAQRTSNEWPAVGVSIPPWISDFSNALMVESGGNMVRWMHITPSKQDIESADRVGLPQAMPAGDSERDVEGRRWDQRKEQMRSAIVYNRNNPSILFYESGNESISEPHMAEMKALRDEYDAHGGRAIGSREMLDSKIAEYGGEMLYINKSAHIPMWAMEYSRDEAARLYQDAQTPPFHADAPDYNRNQDSQAAEDVRRWWDYYRIRPGTGRRVSSGGVNIIWSDSNTHYRGDNNYRRSGEVDAVRIPKEGFYAHKVMWNGWVDVERPATHIVGHWTYAPGTMKAMSVVSTGDRVELFLNGRSLGIGKRSSGFLFTWPDVAWQPGTLRAVGTSADGRTSEHVVETVGAPVALRLTKHTGPRGFVMDGADIALVDVEVVDAKGRRVPTANDKVTFALTGPAEWRGGIAQGDSSGRPRSTVAKAEEAIPGTTPTAGTARDEDNYILSKTVPVEGGINRVLLRAGTAKGTVRLTATAPGLKAATLVVPTVAAARVEGGLSRSFAGDAQPGLLTRGPTPAGPSYRVSRTTLMPSSIVAGSRQADAGKSIDDNELTHWASDGAPATAWIEYRFDTPVTLNEIELKLVGWRSRGYPLRITLDGREIWTGETERQLGYASVSFPAATGRVLRLTQIAPTQDRDAFGKIVELGTAKQSGDTGAEAVAPGWRLAIVEADFHGPVAR